MRGITHEKPINSGFLSCHYYWTANDYNRSIGTKIVGALGRKVIDMSENGAIREFSSSGVSTFLHHTELGEAIKQMTFERDTYLGVAKVFGLRNKEYLMENLQGLKVGDRVTLYRKYNSEDESCTAVAVSNTPDDGSSIRVHTLAGLCLGYIQFPERYVMAELMKAGKHLYAKVHELNVPRRKEDLDTHNAVSLDIYWMEETNPLKIANTYELDKPNEKYEAMKPNGNAIWLMNVVPSRHGLSTPDTPEAHQEVKVGDKLRLIKTADIDDPWCIEVWTEDKKRPMGHMDSWDSPMIVYMLDAGKHVYGVVSGFYTKDFSNNIRFDVFVEDN